MTHLFRLRRFNQYVRVCSNIVTISANSSFQALVNNTTSSLSDDEWQISFLSFAVATWSTDHVNTPSRAKVPLAACHRMGQPFISVCSQTDSDYPLTFFLFFFFPRWKQSNESVIIRDFIFLYYLFFYFKKRFDYLSLQLQYDVEFPQITSTKIFHTTISATTRYY